MNNVKIGSNRSFGLVFFTFFLLISLYPLINGESIRIWSLIISAILLVLGLLNSKTLTPLNKIWFKFGLLIGSVVSPIVMSVVFFIVITPISLMMRILGKDILNLKRNNNDSYWIEKTEPKSKMKNQF